MATSTINRIIQFTAYNISIDTIAPGAISEQIVPWSSDITPKMVQLISGYGLLIVDFWHVSNQLYLKIKNTDDTARASSSARLIAIY